jgi:hypothetical protein
VHVIAITVSGVAVWAIAKVATEFHSEFLFLLVILFTYVNDQVARGVGGDSEDKLDKGILAIQERATELAQVLYTQELYKFGEEVRDDVIIQSVLGAAQLGAFGKTAKKVSEAYEFAKGIQEDYKNWMNEVKRQFSEQYELSWKDPKAKEGEDAAFVHMTLLWDKGSDNKDDPGRFAAIYTGRVGSEKVNRRWTGGEKTAFTFVVSGRAHIGKNEGIIPGIATANTLILDSIVGPTFTVPTQRVNNGRNLPPILPASPPNRASD